MVLRPGNGRAIAGINTNTSRPRQNCAAAHALGHLLLHTQELIVCCTIRLPSHDRASAMATRAQETAANRFAAALLMPEKLVPQALAAWLAQTQPDPAHLQRDALTHALARTFAVSREMVIYRLAALGLTAL